MMEVSIRRSIVGEYLHEKRTHRGLTQQDVARKLKYSSPQFVSNWERGIALPPMDALPVLVKMYDIDPEEIIEVLMQYERKALELQRRNLDKLFKKRKSS